MCEETFPASLRVIGSLNQNSLFLEGTCILRVLGVILYAQGKASCKTVPYI